MKKNLLLIIVLVITSCSSQDKDSNREVTSEEHSSMMAEEDVTDVKATRLQMVDFNHEIIANGTVSARKKADLKFTTSEIVASIYVKNGNRVSKGQKIAELDKFKLQNSLKQAKESLDKSELELKDVLIGQGYSPSDTTNIPASVMKLATLRSGFGSSKNQYELATYNFKNAVLYAPFDGIVANLFTLEHNLPVSSEPFCTIIDNRQPEIIFMVLESEIFSIRQGDKVLVSPFAVNDYLVEGRVTEINPVVDKNGMVKVKARANTSDKLYDGMNVKVRIQRKTDKQLVIPKEALVLRSNRKVVFTAKNGKAMWNYVQTGMENSEGYVVTEGLTDGDSIIYDGNINLAHEAPIRIVP